LKETEPSNGYNSISTHSSASNVSRQMPQSAANEIANKSAYATVAPGQHAAPSANGPAPKFRVPFDEGPTMSTLDNIVEHVENIPQNVQIERGYHIIGKVKTTEDQLKKILAVGDMRIWQ
jgi:hypothetical protein